MKRPITILLTLLLMLTLARADEVVIHPDLPPVDVTVTDSGIPADESLERPNTLAVTVSRGGDVLQQFTYGSLETADSGGIVPLAQAMDINFDGYADLLLLTAQGARNVYQAASVYNAETGLFDPVLTYPDWNWETHAFTGEAVQLELCIPELYPEHGIVVTTEADGYACGVDTAWVWEGRALRPAVVAERYFTGDPDAVGERVTTFATQTAVLWDETYPDSWYYGQDRVTQERFASMDPLTLATAEPEFMTVANVDWVNVRKLDSKSSEAIAGLNAGAEVRVLGRAAGEGEGWVRVLIHPDEAQNARFIADGHAAGAGITGYIWQSYLEPAM